MDQQTGTDQNENQTETDRRQWGLSAAMNTAKAPTAKCGLKTGTFPVSPGSQACLSPHTAPPPWLHSPTASSSPPLCPRESPTPTFSAVFYKAEHKKELGSCDSDGVGRGGGSGRLRSPSKLENLPSTLISRVSNQYPPSP